jgi:hypothetical protein
LRERDFLRGAASESDFDDDLDEDFADDFAGFPREAFESLFSASGAAFALCPRREPRLLPDFALVLDEDESLLSAEVCVLFLLRARVLVDALGSAMRSRRPDETLVPEMWFQLRNCVSETPKRSATETSVSPRCVV